MVLVGLSLCCGSCTSPGVILGKRTNNEPTYQILPRVRADALYRSLRQQNADIQAIHRFLLSKSFYLDSTQVLTEESRTACIALYKKPQDIERIGIVAVKMESKDVVETTAGILGIEHSTGTPYVTEGPKLKTTSPTSLSGWWSCVIQHGATSCEARCVGPDNPDNPADRIACLEATCGFPLVYFWYRRCY
jgi:hypothetical protein